VRLLAVSAGRASCVTGTQRRSPPRQSGGLKHQAQQAPSGRARPDQSAWSEILIRPRLEAGQDILAINLRRH